MYWDDSVSMRGIQSCQAWWEDPKPEDDNEMGDLDESMQDLAEPNASKLLH